MATPAQATIVHILGDAYLRDATGKLTALKPGDHVNENQVVVTGPDGSMVLQLPNGEQVAIGEDRSLLVDAAFLGTAPAEPQDAVLSQVDQDTAQVAQVLAQGGDISELLDPAAAGLTAAGENSGHSFIRLMRVVESVDPLAFNFGQTGSETPPDIDLGLAAADQALANAAPVGADAHHVIEEDTSVTGRIVASDPNGDPLSFTMADNGMPTHGTVVLGPDGTYVYTPNQDYNGSDRFVVEVSDGRGGTTTVVITIDITPVNDPPVGEDQAIVTNEDVPVSGQLVAHDVDGDPLTFTKASDPQHGTVVINPDGSYTYTPAQDYNGKDSFTVTVDDGQGGQDTIVVTIDVMPMPDPAIITPATPGADQGLVKEDTIFTTSGKLDIVDPDAGEAVFNAGTIQDGPYGSLTIDAAGNWTYTLNNADPAVQVLKEGESIVRPITVTSADGTTHVITVTIQGTNETATLGSGTVQEDTTLTADGTLVATGVATFVPSTQAGTYGSLTVDAAGHWVYTLNNADPVVQALVTGETKVETFTVTLDDGATTTVTINVLGLDDGAIIVPHTPGADAGTVKEDVTLTVSGKLDVTDPDAGQAVFNAGTINDGAYGSLTIDAAGNWTYTLNNADPAVQVLKEGESIVRPITVTSADGTTHVITVTIQGTNETATLGSGTVQEDTTLTADGTLVATGVATFVPSTQAGTYGSLTVDAAGHWVYTLNNADPVVQALVTGETKVETFTVTLDDGATTTVTINVLGLDDGAIIVPHTPGADAGTVKEDVTLTVSGKLDVTDPDAGQAVFNAGTINDGVYGSLTIDAAGNWTYTLNNADPAVQVLKEGESIVRPITVTSADGTTHVITVTIQGTNETATLGSGTVQEDTTLTADGTLVATGVATFVPSTQAGTYGSLTVDAAGHWVYTLNNADPVVQALVTGETKVETFTVTLDDGATTTVTINVLGLDDGAIIVPHTPGADAGTVKEDVTLTVSGKLDVTDPDAGQAVFNAGTINDGVYGSLTIDAAGNWTYTLNNADPAVQVLKEGESIVRPITVTSADGTTHVITVTIQGTNETATLGSGTVQEDTTLTADGTLVATGVATFVPSTQAGTYGSLTVDAAGHWVYTLNNADPVVQALVTGETKVETFTVTLDDGATTTVTINVLGLDDGAIIVPHTPGADAGTVKEDVILTVSGKLDVTDPDAGQAVFNAGTINDGVYGSLTIDAAGNWTYTLNNADPAVQGLKEGETVIRPITVTSADGTTHIVTVTILGTNDVPTARNDNAQTLEDTPLTLSTGTLLVNDTDPDGDPLTVISVQDPTHGTVTLVGGNIIFTPDPDYNGPASFTYTISDGQGGTSTATVNIHVIPVNDAPTTCGGMVTGIEDTPLILHWGDFNASDIDTPASGLSIVVGSLPADGLLQYKDGGGNWVSAAVGQVFSKSFIDSGNLRFLPTLNESGSDDFGGNGVGNKEADYARFNYTVYDGELSSNVGTMRIDITPVADTPQLSLEATTSTTHVTDFQNITLPDNPGWTPNVKASDMISFGTSTWQTDNPGGLLEVGYQHIYLGGAQSTNKVIELERNAGDPANLYTDLQAQTGDIFQLAFDYSSRMQSSSLINVYWEGQLIKVLNSDTPGFQHFTLNLVATQDGTSRLEFRAGNSDSYGGVLDGISLGKVDDNIGLQDQWIHLSKISAQLTDTDGSETLAVSIKDIPVGAQLTDGTHTFTATAGATSVDVTNWSLDSLQLKPPAGFVGDLQLQVSATATETANGDQATASNVIDVTVLLNNQPPTVGSQSLTALEGVPSHLIIDIPTDPNGDALTVTVTTLPTTGQILTDGGTAVQVGDTLSIHQLTSLQYISPTDIVGTQAAGSFGYAVSDGYNTVHDSLTIQVVDNPAIIHGRDGNDQITVAYGEAGDGTTVYAQYGAYVDGSGVPHGAEGPVVINTTGTAQVFDAGGGNDYVEGGAGNDVIYLGDSGGTAGTVNEDLGLKFVLNDGLMTTADHLVTQASDGMLSAAAKTSQPVADLANGGSGDDIIFGGGGTDLIYGGAGDDVLYGGAQSDGLRGGAGNDTLIGGPGSDALRGDLGNDVFKWTLGDQQATPGATALGGGNYLHLPSSVNVAKGATDVVMDFNMSTADGDNDKLDLRDLLQGELHSDGNIGNLTNYLRLETVPNTGGGGSSTVIHISHDGGFSGGYNLAAEDQTIVLQNVDLGANDTTNAAVIQDLLNKGKLVTD